MVLFLEDLNVCCLRTIELRFFDCLQASASRKRIRLFSFSHRLVKDWVYLVFTLWHHVNLWRHKISAISRLLVAYNARTGATLNRFPFDVNFRCLHVQVTVTFVGLATHVVVDPWLHTVS